MNGWSPECHASLSAFQNEHARLPLFFFKWQNEISHIDIMHEPENPQKTHKNRIFSTKTSFSANKNNSEPKTRKERVPGISVLWSREEAQEVEKERKRTRSAGRRRRRGDLANAMPLFLASAPGCPKKSAEASGIQEKQTPPCGSPNGQGQEF